MQNLIIEGKNKLNGRVKIGGMKNSALPIIYSTILIKGVQINTYNLIYPTSDCYEISNNKMQTTHGENI